MGLIQVVAAAIVRDGRVLAARRSAPARHAGGWEFPGGKIEQDEDDATALIRECREELGVGIDVGARLAEASNEDVRIVLFAAVLVEGEPRPLEDHDELRWLAGHELDGIDWLPIDLELITRAPGRMRDLNRCASM